jgi:hypothetical protein
MYSFAKIRADHIFLQIEIEKIYKKFQKVRKGSPRLRLDVDIERLNIELSSIPKQAGIGNEL